MNLSLRECFAATKKINWVCLIIIALFFYGAMCYIKTKSIDVPTFHMDGAFQTASGLFRLWHGELPGKDFYPYLGIGPIALIYPIFWFAGSNLCASVFASYATLYAANIFLIGLLIHFLWKPKTFLISIATACALFTLPQLLMFDSSPLFNPGRTPDWLNPMLAPGNSLRPLRTFIIYMSIGALYFIIIPEKNIKKKFVYFGLLAAVISLWSNDYALLTMAFVFFTSLVSFIKDSPFHFFKTTVYLTLVSIVSISIAQFIVTGGHPIKLVKYNFLDVANDQWWYFGFWLEGYRIFTLKELTKIYYQIQQINYSIPIFLASFISIFLFKKYRLELFLIFMAGALSLVGGIVACVGGHIMDGYFDGFKFWTRLIVLLFCLRLVSELIFFVFKKNGRTLLYIPTILFSLTVTGVYAYYANQYQEIFKVMRKDNLRYFYVPELGGYLDSAWYDYIAYIKAHKDKSAVEEYSGIWSAFLKKPSIWPVDSAIHALGGVRRVAEQSLREKADIVITSARVVSNEWLDWNVSVNYWLYKILFESYTPVFYSPTTIVWEKNSKAHSEWRSVNCTPSEDKIFLDVPTSGYYEVTLTSQTQHLANNRYLTMFENNMNYSVFEIGKISLSPHENTQMFPVFAAAAGKNEFGFEVRPLGTVKMSIVSCSAKEIPFKNYHVLIMSEGPNKIYEKNADDGNYYSGLSPWDRGISTDKAAFFVFKNKQTLNEFKVGNLVKLRNNDVRIITGLGGSSYFLEVFLDGEKLNPDRVGIPSEFTVLDDNQLEAIASKMGDAIFITDGRDWENGISIREPAFLVANTEKNRQRFTNGKNIQIPNSEVRTIISVVPRGIYLQVWLNGGALLDSKKTGLPSGFTVLPNGNN